MWLHQYITWTSNLIISYSHFLIHRAPVLRRLTSEVCLATQHWPLQVPVPSLTLTNTKHTYSDYAQALRQNQSNPQPSRYMLKLLLEATAHSASNDLSGAQRESQFSVLFTGIWLCLFIPKEHSAVCVLTVRWLWASYRRMLGVVCSLLPLLLINI